MLQLFLLTLSLLPWMPVFHCKVTMDGEYSVLEGGFLTIPCHYGPQYVSNVKYWCQGKTREFCTSLARTDDARRIGPAVEKVSIFDDPVQLVSTVTMNNLKEGDSGWYMCGVEIGNLWKADDVGYTNIKVIHGLSAVHSQVSGEEGSSVAAECVYSERLRDSVKMWCRSGDPRSCRSTGSEGIYEDSSVVIRDDRIGAFTIIYKKLEKGDTAWYWCSAGQQKTPVYILVTPLPTTTSTSKSTPPMTNKPPTHLAPPHLESKETWHGHTHLLAIMVVCLCIIVLGVVVMVARKLWNFHRKDSVLKEVAKMKAKYNVSELWNVCLICLKLLKNNHPITVFFSFFLKGNSGDVDDLESVAVVFLNKNSEEVLLH
uniref:Polymeric immunoglobulin receptor n=1 Tax=Oryzias latipes TaxID=8090 RepID=A0A3P9LWE3_ORYLA